MVLRAFYFATAAWLEDQEAERMKRVIAELIATFLGAEDDNKKARGRKGRSQRQRRRG